jgi:hypothetical protein
MTKSMGNNTAVVTTATVSTNGTAAILAANNARRIAYIKVPTGGATVYLGASSSITTTAGFPVDAGDTFIDVESDGAWYAKVASGTQVVNVIEVS